MADINALFPSKWLKASDVASGVDVQIAGLKMEHIQENEAEKPVLYFNGHTKGLVLNKTNGLMIAHSYTPETDNWVGKMIHMRSEPVAFQGKIVDSIRVSCPQPDFQKPPVSDVPTDSVPPTEDIPW